jgi:hypothetical protein
MTKSKSQTNQEILSSASSDDNNISQIRVRHVESQHPVDCLCDLCRNLRFSPNSPIAENSEKDKLNWYKGE